MSILHWAIFSPFILAILVPLLYKRVGRIHTGWFVLVLPVLLFIYFFQFISVTSMGDSIRENVSWIPTLDIGIDFYIDGLGLLFALLITGIGSLVILYSIFYLSKEKEKLNQFYVYLLLFMGAMLGIVLSDNLIVLYMFWEFTSLSSFLLIGYWNEREKSRNGAQKSMLITVFGGLSMLGGFVMLGLMGGTFSIRALIAESGSWTSHSLFIPAMLLILLGAFTKSAQFPFHIWLPDAMEAPTPVSAYLHSATMVKAGIYLVARLSPIFAQIELWFWIVSIAGLLTLCWGSFFAVKQTDLKGILAFSTVSQLGLIMSLLGLGAAALHYDGLDDQLYMAATVAAVFHLINHATFKGSLFMAAGIIDHETGTRDIRKLGGLMTYLPVTFTITVIGAFSMAGLPPFNGFLSKEMFFTSMVNVVNLNIFDMETWGYLFPAAAWIASIFTFIYSMILLFKTFTGKAQLDKLEKEPHEAPIGMLISPIVLAALVITFGLFPNILSTTLIEPAVSSIQPAADHLHVHISFWHGFGTEVWMTIGVIVLGILLYLSLSRWNSIYHIVPERFSLNALYDSILKMVNNGSGFIAKAVMKGSIRSYLIYIFAFFILMMAFSLYHKGAFRMNTENTAPIGVYEIILALVMIIGSISILFAKSRLTSIIILGAVGYTVALFFVIFRAPDLALTQLVIETISVALFLLCFYHLPKLASRKEERMTFKLNNAVISIGVGLVVALVALSAQSQKFFAPISSFYLENAYKEAGGKNVVNVILVDFRGLDTMFEIAVLGIAALGIFAMIKLRLTRGNK
ncbi:Na+/H+ antiporter subunit A [Bacillus massiliglaciei]|uniref:Na+/H+ antiporter subunit A n=1 Tax=Bacillus massiliglaciei TaxID=1816693 RepID=UPI000B2D6D5B|nr:Na+/H+ antiporter subunit A [Bacillus massiliglaciei]